MNRGRINLLLSTAAFAISSAGSVLLHIVLAMAIYAETSSGLMTSLFISLQWLPVLLVILYRSDWDHGMNPRKRWYLLDLVSAALTLPIFFAIPGKNYLVVVAFLAVRGVFDHVNRINKTVAARVLFPAEKTTHYASFLQSGYHVGIGTAAVAGVLLASRVSLQTVVLVDLLTFVVSAVLVFFSRCVENVDFPKTAPRKPLGHRIAEYRDSLEGDPRLFFCAILPPLTATFFQGSYSVLQPIFPVERFGLGSSAVSLSYLMTSLGIVAGSSGFTLFLKKSELFKKGFLQTRVLVISLSILAGALYLGSTWVSVPVASLVLFTLMIVVFEFIWMLGYGGIVAFAPKGQLGSVFGISFAIGCVAASVLAAGVGALLDVLGNDFTKLVGLLMLTYLLIIAAAAARYASHTKGAVPEAAG